MKQGTAVVGFLLSFLSGAGLIYGLEHRAPVATRDAAAAGFAADDRESALPVGPGDAVWGSAGAPVTVTIFSDFQCPFCARLGPTFDKLRQAYGPDRLRVVWKQNPLSNHKDARPAAIAAQAVLAAKGSDAFWKFHDLAFKNQQALTEDNFAKWAQEVGVDAASFQRLKADPAVAKKVDEDVELGRRVGVSGTPYVFVNGANVPGGAVPFEKFKEQIDQQLEKAKAKLASGVKPERLYAAMVKDNLTPAKPAAAGPDRKAELARREEEAKVVWKVPLGKAPVTGGDKAPVTIVLFSDYQCPFCKRAEDAIKKVTDAYGDKVRVAWKDMPLPNHPRARPAANFALEARAQKGDKAFWEAHDKLFASAPKLEEADFERIAGEMGLDFAKVKDAIAKDKHKAAIEADQNQLDDLGAGGTPQLYVNGRHIAGAPAPEALRAMVEEELKKAEALAAKGTPPGKMYDEIMKEGKELPPPEKKQVAAPGKEQAFKGGAKAKVVIQEFSDFECPACARAEPTIKQVMEAYGDKVKFVWRHRPLGMHKHAPLASEAAIELQRQKGNDGFWKFHDKLFESQRAPGGLERPALEKYAEELGADMAQFRKALDEHAHKAAVDADSKLADDASMPATPSFLINGYFVSGAQPFGKFKKIIDRALAEAG